MCMCLCVFLCVCVDIYPSFNGHECGFNGYENYLNILNYEISKSGL
jgi:hypothetical protein